MSNLPVKPIIITPEIETRFQSFILFEPSSTRVNDFDILLNGEQVTDMYEAVTNYLSDDDSLKTLIIKNKLTKIGQMLSLLQNHDGVLISKFFDRIWRRYSYISNIGETFLDLKTFLEIFPKYREDINQLIAVRLDEEDEDDIESTGDVSTTSVEDTVPLDELVEKEEDIKE